MPWKTLLVHAPTLVDAARHLYATTRSPAERSPTTRGHDDVVALRRAVEELEAREVQQAALVADLAKQVNALTTAVEVLRARIVFALVGAAAALVISLVTVAVLVWR
jgi:hypothetical protein